MLEVRKLDKSVPIPLYFQLKTILLDAIKRGDYPVDSMIPTEKELSEMFQISRTTVRQAITEMVQEGWLYRIASKGTFVARLKIKQDFIKRLESFNDQIARTGCKPSTELLELKVTEMPKHMCNHFGLNTSEKFVYLYRRRLADDDPIVTVETYLPFDKCAFVLAHDFEKESLYNVLAESGKARICRVTRILEAVGANTQDVDNLNVRRGKPIQLSTTIGYNDAEEPIEYSVARYRGDRNRFEVDLLIDTRIEK
ncbi:GntR family transcriptional regulator [Butyricicoccus sp.]|uniref:GntR family transcriptional regulator n=1 Tax=Butyricicoccus sp. TaxID=2049021 RepID=UPI003AB0C1BB